MDGNAEGQSFRSADDALEETYRRARAIRRRRLAIPGVGAVLVLAVAAVALGLPDGGPDGGEEAAELVGGEPTVTTEPGPEPTLEPTPQPTPEPGAGQSADDLRGRTFLAVSVTEDGERREFVDDTRLEVDFLKEGEHRDGDGVRWWAGCNEYGAPVEILPEQLRLLERPGMTEIGCEEERIEQDDRFAAFFEADPRWEIDGERLTLTAEDVRIELVEGEGEYYPRGSGE